MKKLFGSALLLVFLLALMATPAFAGADNYPYLTFEDSADFTIVAPRISAESITARGLDANFVKQVISDPININWASSDTNVARVLPARGATVIVTARNVGRATITASYECADGTVIECPANVVVERRINPSTGVDDVEVTVLGDPAGSGIDIDLTGDDAVDIPMFSLKDVFGSGFDDSDVLQMDPSALHALLYTLELTLGDGQTIPDWHNWNWTWVNSHGVVITSQGSYVQEIDGDVSGWPVGWKFMVNGDELEAASSIAEIQDTDEVDWAFRQ